MSCFSGPPSLPPGELALQGCTVHVYDQGPVTLQKVHSTITEHLQELRHQGLLGEEQQLRVSELPSYPGSSHRTLIVCTHAVQGSVIVDSLLSGAVSEAEIVIEAVSEDLEVKNLLFRGQTISWYAASIYRYQLLPSVLPDIASVCSKETILCTNTLTLQLSDVFSDIPHPEVVQCLVATHYSPIPSLREPGNEAIPTT